MARQKQLYTVLRIENKECRKIKNWGGLARYQKHANREQQTLNADEAKRNLNITLKGNANDIVGTVKDYMESKGLEVKGIGANNQSRIVTELLLTASPEFFYKTEKNSDGSIKEIEHRDERGNVHYETVYEKDAEGNRILDEQRTMEWIYQNDRFLKEKYGDQYVFGMCHLDESTPHLSVLICGNDYHGKWKKQILSHSKNFGSAKKLRALQTDYTKSMQNVGFQELGRGIKKSKRRHEDISKWYGRENQKDDALRKIKEKAVEIITAKVEELEDIKQDLDNTKIRAGLEVEARERVIQGFQQMTNIEKNKVDKAISRARQEVGLEDTKVTQNSYNKSSNQQNQDGHELER